MNIVCNIDDAYVKYCFVMLTSLFENNKGEKINIHIIAGYLNETNMQILKELSHKYDHEIFFYLVGEELLKNYPTYSQGHISLSAYLRIFTAQVLPTTIHKALYLDCDLIVCGPLHDLWNIEIPNVAIACVEDMWSGKQENYERLGYDKKYSYFNSGVLLMNLDYWREYNIIDQVVNYILMNGPKLVFYDQDALNAILYDKKKFIDFRWNMQDGFFRTKRKIRPEMTTVLDEELKRTIIIHYTGGKKPWDYKSKHPYKKEYFKYLDMTKWKGQRPSVPLSYRIKLFFDNLFILTRLAKPKYRKVH